MAVTQSPRMALTRWSDPLDPFTRDQMDDDHAQLEQRAAGYLIGATVDRPAAGPTNVGYLHVDDTTGVATFSTGAEWVAVGGSGGGFAHSFLTMGA